MDPVGSSHNLQLPSRDLWEGRELNAQTRKSRRSMSSWKAKTLVVTVALAFFRAFASGRWEKVRVVTMPLPSLCWLGPPAGKYMSETVVLRAQNHSQSPHTGSLVSSIGSPPSDMVSQVGEVESEHK